MLTKPTSLSRQIREYEERLNSEQPNIQTSDASDEIEKQILIIQNQFDANIQRKRRIELKCQQIAAKFLFLCENGDPDGLLPIICQFEDRSGIDFNAGLKLAARGGYRNIVVLLINNGATDWLGAMIEAQCAGNTDIAMQLAEGFGSRWKTLCPQGMNVTEHFAMLSHQKK
ncbi:MAG: hypothetical protein M0R33_15540 [Methylomonas sp.]|jgi:hypothetical protein|uniref:hypothetical protein n=1 Tax=Methylomonas sp. TaxID=418 RepID=UPI0025FD84D6|nr:hypothetical protein [Methylomonas sp.]MCK9607856.1 hypothetical protein [Methylomonas sp.]